MPNIDILMDHSEVMRGWAHNKATEQFAEFWKLERDVVVAKMRDAKEVSEIFRLQGELIRIDKFFDTLNYLRLSKDAQKGIKPTGGK